MNWKTRSSHEFHGIQLLLDRRCINLDHSRLMAFVEPHSFGRRRLHASRRRQREASIDASVSYCFVSISSRTQVIVISVDLTGISPAPHYTRVPQNLGPPMGRPRSRSKDAKTTAPQQPSKTSGVQNNKQTYDPAKATHRKPGDKYVSHAGRPLQATRSSQHQRTYQKTVHVNCNQRNAGRSLRRPTPAQHPSVQPPQVSNARRCGTETNNSNSQVTQPGDDPSDSPMGRKKRRRHSRKIQSQDQEDGEQNQERSQSNIIVSNHIESSQTTTPIVYYAIRNGAYGYYGVHTDWNVCVRYLKGATGATFKSFADEEEAFEFAHGDYNQVTSSPPEKKLKREEFRQTAKLNSQESTQPRTEKRSREKVQRSRETKLSTTPRQQQRQATRTEPRPNVRSRSFSGSFSRNPKTLPLKGRDDSIQVEDDSVDEAEEPQIRETNRKTDQVPSSEPCSEVQFVADLGLQNVKVEPVLLPRTRNTSRANLVPEKAAKDVKREEILAQTGPQKSLRMHPR